MDANHIQCYINLRAFCSKIDISSQIDISFNIFLRNLFTIVDMTSITFNVMLICKSFVVKLILVLTFF